MAPASELSDHDLNTEILTWAGRVAAGEARLLDLIGEADERGSWFSIGFLSCAHWLSCRVGLGMGAARERVRVARALRELPLIRAAMHSGRMSYAQVRAATRVATRFDEQKWIDLAVHATGSQLERLVRGVARVRRQEQDEADPAAAIQRLRTTHTYHDDGTFTMTFRGSAADGAELLAAVESACDDLDRIKAAEEQEEVEEVYAETQQDHAPDGTHAQARGDAADVPAESPGDSAADVSAETQQTVALPPGTVTPSSRPLTPEQAAIAAETRRRKRTDLGQGLMHLARKGLEALGREHPESARRSRSRLSVHVDPLSGWARLRDGDLLPPTSLKQIATTLPGRHQLRPLTGKDLRVHDQGRSARHPSLALRELLGTVDGERCRLPGCTATHRLHAHHVVYWENGGPTDLANLVLVCTRHHTLIHQHGYQLILSADRTLVVRTADGTRLLPHHAPAWRDASDLPDVSAGTLRSGESDQRLDLGYAVSVLAQHAA